MSIRECARDDFVIKDAGAFTPILKQCKEMTVNFRVRCKLLKVYIHPISYTVVSLDKQNMGMHVFK